jgi:uncharacterized protein
MKLQADRSNTLTINAHGPGWVAVNGIRHQGSLVIDSQTGVHPWGCAAFTDLTAAHFEPLAAYRPELVLLGSGTKLRFVHPSLLQSLINQHIGVETMDTAAACRTYNILAGEGRRVVAALLVEPM